MMADDKKLTESVKAFFKGLGRNAASAFSKGVLEDSEHSEKTKKAFFQEFLDMEKSFYQEKDKLETEMDQLTEEKYAKQYQRKLQTAKNANTIINAQINETYRKQKNAYQDYIDSVEENLKRIEAQIKLFKEEIVYDFNEIAEAASDSLEEFESSRQKMEDKLKSYGGLFRHQTLTFVNAGKGGQEEVYEQFLPDLSKRLETLKLYGALMTEIRGRTDIPKELFHAIRDLPVEDAVRFQEALLSLDAGALGQYTADWEAINQLAEMVSDESYRDEILHAVQLASEELEAWYGTIPEAFFTEGELSAEAFSTAFVKKIETLQAQMSDAVLSVVPNYETRVFSDNEQREDGASHEAGHTTYILNGSGETATEQLRAARAHAELVRMRGECSGVNL